MFFKGFWEHQSIIIFNWMICPIWCTQCLCEPESKQKNFLAFAVAQFWILHNIEATIFDIISLIVKILELMDNILDIRFPSVNLNFGRREDEIHQRCTLLCASSLYQGVVHNNIHILTISVVLWILVFNLSASQKIFILLTQYLKILMIDSYSATSRVECSTKNLSKLSNSS